MSATAAVVENKLEPINKAPETRQLIVTGQGLYNMFMVPDAQTQTRMTWIREVLVPNADPIQVKGACDELVKLAGKQDEANGVPEKERGPKRNTAMNVRTFIQQIYGALKFAPAELTAMGFTDQTGWLEARNMAKPALERAGKIWTGHDIPSDAQKEQKTLARKNKAETQAFLEATKETPRALNEAFDTWQARIAAVAQNRVAKAREDAMLEQAEKELERLTKKYDREVLALIMSGLQSVLKEENAGKSELSEEETNALLAQAAEEGKVEIHEEEEVAEE